MGSPESEEYDQVLEDAFVGPIQVGTNKFTLQTPPPDASKIPPTDLLGATLVLLSALFHDHEFIRIGYYVNNEYVNPELRENPPPIPEHAEGVDLSGIRRILNVAKPRITLFPIDWDNPSADFLPQEEVLPDDDEEDDANVDDDDDDDDDDEGEDDDDDDDDDIEGPEAKKAKLEEEPKPEEKNPETTEKV